jgi:hypothetical protein
MAKFPTTKQLMKKELEKLNALSDVNKVLRIIALESMEMVTTRIQQNGKNSNGDTMVTSSPTKFGAYSKAWGNKRNKSGFQTSIIDLTFTGDMFEAWRIFPFTQKSIGVGFFGETESAKSRYLTKRFGRVFEITAKERKQVLETLRIEVNKILQQ